MGVVIFGVNFEKWNYKISWFEDKLAPLFNQLTDSEKQW